MNRSLSGLAASTVTLMLFGTANAQDPVGEPPPADTGMAMDSHSEQPTEVPVSTEVTAQEDVRAEEEAQETPESAWPTNLHASGFVDTYMMFNLNGPEDRTAGLRAFDKASNQFSLNLAELAVYSEPEPLGFRLDLDFGPTTDLVHAGEPGGGVEVFKHIQQAYGSVRFDNGLQLDIGKMVTAHGQEVIESRDNWNYSRSLLFTYAIPFYHFGVRATYPINDNITTCLWLVNGWDNVTDNNAAKSLHLSFMYTSDMINAYLNYMVGNEVADEDKMFETMRHLIDATVLVSPMDGLQLGVNADFGMQPEAVGDESATWFGVAVSGRYAFTPSLAGALRAEYFSDGRAFRTGVMTEEDSVSMWEVTGTFEGRYADNMIARLEYRHDQVSEEVFVDGDGEAKKSQDTFTIGTIIGF